MNIMAFTKTYGTKRVLNMPEISLEKDRIYAVVGANGSGKSTLAGVLAQTVSADGGKMPLSGKIIGYMPQKSFAFRMSTEKNVRLGGNDEKRAAELISALGLTQLQKKNARKLSGGETARMSLARILMRDCEMLILDEPTAAMDMEFTILSEKLICEYCKRTRCTVLLITHSLTQARRMADELIYLQDGELVEQGKTEKMLTAPQTEQFKRFLNFYGT